MNSLARKDQVSSTAPRSPGTCYVVPGTEDELPRASSRPETSGNILQKYISIDDGNVQVSQEKARQVGWWLGRVEHVYDDYFTAVLEDKYERTSSAEFDKEELTPSELNLLEPNARFSYTVTLVDKHSGREYVTKISLSGKPIWRDKDFKKAEESLEETFPQELFDF